MTFCEWECCHRMQHCNFQNTKDSLPLTCKAWHFISFISLAESPGLKALFALHNYSQSWQPLIVPLIWWCSPSNLFNYNLRQRQWRLINPPGLTTGSPGSILMCSCTCLQTVNRERRDVWADQNIFTNQRERRGKKREKETERKR